MGRTGTGTEKERDSWKIDAVGVECLPVLRKLKDESGWRMIIIMRPFCIHSCPLGCVRSPTRQSRQFPWSHPRTLITLYGSEWFITYLPLITILADSINQWLQLLVIIIIHYVSSQERTTSAELTPCPRVGLSLCPRPLSFPIILHQYLVAAMNNSQLPRSGDGE